MQSDDSTLPIVTPVYNPVETIGPTTGIDIVRIIVVDGGRLGGVELAILNERHCGERFGSGV